MLLIDELFMFLCPLYMGLLEQDLNIRFYCSVPTVSRKIVTWANFLYFVLGTIPIWLTKTQIQDLMPYTGARCVRKKNNKKILYNTTRGRTHLLPFF
jgi:hypothetical protein